MLWRTGWCIIYAFCHWHLRLSLRLKYSEKHTYFSNDKIWMFMKCISEFTTTARGIVLGKQINTSKITRKDTWNCFIWSSLWKRIQITMRSKMYRKVTKNKLLCIQCFSCYCKHFAFILIINVSSTIIGMGCYSFIFKISKQRPGIKWLSDSKT